MSGNEALDNKEYGSNKDPPNKYSTKLEKTVNFLEILYENFMMLGEHLMRSFGFTLF